MGTDPILSDTRGAAVFVERASMSEITELPPLLAGAIQAVIEARHGDPFAVLGMRQAEEGGPVEVRAFLPGAKGVSVLDTATDEIAGELTRVGETDFFLGELAGRTARFRYRLRVEYPLATVDIEDAYRFGEVLGDLDIHLMVEGNHLEAYKRLGAHPTEIDGVKGVAFSVWAPNASRCSVVGDFCDWDGRRFPMRKRVEAGVWEIFVPGVEVGRRYKFEISGPGGELLPLKADPYAFESEMRPATASVVRGLTEFEWTDDAWIKSRASAADRTAPVSIYEAHLASWARVPEDGDRFLTYGELAARLVPYVKEMGFTHIELLPVSEHPFDGSWGYQPIGLYAPTSRFGSPDDFKRFVDTCHAANIGVLLDWVPGHFPTDSHGLAWFDGTHLYEHADPRKGFQPDWNTLIYNFGRREVANFLLGNALFWMDQFHIDGLRVDAVASMLYLDYSRKNGEWIPNRFGGKENLEAIDFMKRMNELVYGRNGGVVTIAEESTAWPAVSKPTYLGGLGFGYKWNMGWMHDTLRFMGKNPIHRRYHHHDLTFGLLYQFSENFVLPLSHDEVVHGKGSLISRMPGDDWQRFANLRAYYGFMWGHPGKKLLFMGGEFGQWREWNAAESLDWHLLEFDAHAGVRELVKRLNEIYREVDALHVYDCEPKGFEWIEANDSDTSVLAFLRNGKDAERSVVVVSNFTPVPRPAYLVGVSQPGVYDVIVNTDAKEFGGSELEIEASVTATNEKRHGREYSLKLTLPPLATVMLRRRA